ncbi:altered inheritance of mitochondria protein 23, mitochondrial [[Candida] jaroonii]|uniref:Altered inheritance of mitochondria protein 23, mitochondrial n=1 Tax=[Candida] jaroonii TaxID=467808 RepID=A0ACA9Y044_9ASCO|nr:altered inheritance of mitochondria protein 23, mitochondrial [[Candida] jaroonii]
MFNSLSKPSLQCLHPIRYRSLSSTNKLLKRPVQSEWKKDKPARLHKQKTFNLQKFSMKGKEVLTHNINKVRELESGFKVQFIVNGKLETKHLADIIEDLNPSSDGIKIVPNKDSVMIRTVPYKQMLEEFNEDKSKMIEQELIGQGSQKALRALQSSKRADKKKSGAKMITLSWNISLGDLNAQKKSEILKRASKGEKFSIFIDTHKANQATITKILAGEVTPQGEDWNIKPMELKRRELIIEGLQAILEEGEVKFEEKGSINKLLILNCVPPAPVEKEVKKQKREKIKKEPKAKPVQRIEENELDSLYSFKIED